MADGITTQSSTLATIPSGTEIATDDAGASGHVQIVKLAIATDGSATLLPGDATDGLLVNLGSNNDVTFAAGAEVKVTDGTHDLEINSDGSINISGTVTATSANRQDSSVTIGGLTTASTLYTAGDQLGTIMELTSMAATSGGKGMIGSFSLLVDKIAVLGPVRVWVFSETVTLASDNAAFSLSDADAAKCIGEFTMPSPGDASNNARCTWPGLNLDYSCAATSLFVGLQTLTTHTVHFDAADDITITARAYRL